MAEKTLKNVRKSFLNYFSKNALNTFFKEEYKVSNLSDRMGMRLEGPKLENTINTNMMTINKLANASTNPGQV